MNRFRKLPLHIVSLLAVGLAVGVSAQISKTTAPGDSAVIATLHAEGAQIYECGAENGKPAARVPAWQFREPIATLIVEGKSIGRHYGGPNWDHIDGSGAKGKIISSTPGTTPNDIAWLKIDVVEHRGNGILSDAVTVERINTRGGMANGSCESAGAYLSVPYSADYVFRRKS